MVFPTEPARFFMEHCTNGLTIFVPCQRLWEMCWLVLYAQHRTLHVLDVASSGVNIDYVSDLSLARTDTL